MTEDPCWIDSHATQGEALRTLLERHVHHLPVLREGVLVGIVSHGDLRGTELLVPDLFDQPVASVMSDKVVSVTPDSDLADVADLMVTHHIGAIPVVDSESTKLVGIVSYVDVLRAARESLWG